MWNLNLKKTFHDLKEWDKKWAKKIQEKFNLSDYQMLCLVFGKGFILGAVILYQSVEVHTELGRITQSVL